MKRLIILPNMLYPKHSLCILNFRVQIFKMKIQPLITFMWWEWWDNQEGSNLHANMPQIDQTPVAFSLLSINGCQLWQIERNPVDRKYRSFSCSFNFVKLNQAPVPLTRFRSNSKFDHIWQCSGFKCALPITTKFCTCYDSVTVVTCAKFRCDWLSIFQTRALPILIEFRIRSKYR